MNSKHRNRKNARLEMSYIQKNPQNHELDVMYEKHRNHRHQKKRTNKYEVNSCDGNISFTWIRHYVGKQSIGYAYALLLGEAVSCPIFQCSSTDTCRQLRLPSRTPTTGFVFVPSLFPGCTQVE